VNENSQTFALVQSEAYAAILPTLWGDLLVKKDFVRIPFKRLDAYSRKVNLVWNPQWKMLKGLDNDMIDKLTQILKLK
jgi:hypothetical protein